METESRFRADGRHKAALVIVVAEFDRVGVSARFEHNEILLGQTLVDVGGQAVEITERRHGSHRAIWKERFEFVFGLQDSRLTGDFLDLFKIDSMVCGKDCHQVLTAIDRSGRQVIGPQHINLLRKDSFGRMPEECVWLRPPPRSYPKNITKHKLAARKKTSLNTSSPVDQRLHLITWCRCPSMTLSRSTMSG